MCGCSCCKYGWEKFHVMASEFTCLYLVSNLEYIYICHRCLLGVKVTVTMMMMKV